ncbi:hypothetical protein FML41_20205 [Klebsiella michiganensis]|uniref:hypothetical protein n=1 Tax=Klebsiella TaxID=570 RepID=UPI0011E3E818|nr:MULTISPECIES: hypothetical protein [Klebsiella]MBM7270989.1 hypothetical protein [Klebsiella pneumoniae]MBZ7750381.1 hypothetical protein [Klebsiella michiganensis]TYE39869.1 hypothetical protein DJ508_29670 [Klebsiella michiganensis]HCJ2570306.1 hypothetical protein [Klebsiella pneumoniae]HCJ2571072.1 hypothetical protein [Klebsiella pneumoniae]
MSTPDKNILIELDNVSRQQCELLQRQKELHCILNAYGDEAFCYALACLMQAEMRFKNAAKKSFKEQ